MLQTILSLIIVLSVSSFRLVQAQVVDIFPGRSEGINYQRIHVQHILPQEGQLGATVISNLRSPTFFQASAENPDVSADGQVFWLGGKLVKKEGDTFRIVEIPLVEELKENQRFPTAGLSNNGQWLLITASNGELDRKERVTEQFFYNVEEERVVTSFIRSPHEFVELDKTKIRFAYTLPPERSNDDFSIFTAVVFESVRSSTASYGESYPIMIERNGTEFRETKLTFSGGLLSSSGDRMISAGLGGGSMIDRLPSGGWSEPKEIIIRDNEGNPLNFTIWDIARNGRRILGSAWQGETPNKVDFGSFVADEQNGEWVPQFIPDASEVRWISEDGDVVVAVPSKLMFKGFYLSDLIVFMQTPSGEWVRRQVNPPNVGVVSALFAKGGRQLFYMPFDEPVPASVQDAPLHNK